MNQNEYLAWVLTDREKIAVKKMLVDIAGDLVAGIVLSQIEYWHLPSKTGHSRLRVEKDGFLWLVKRAADWQEECRISGKQAARALRILEDAKLIITTLAMFNGAPTTHIRINWPVFLARVQAEIDKRVQSISTEGENRITPKGKIELPQRDDSITDTTSETTSNTSSSSGSSHQRPNIYTVYEKNIGPLTPMIAERLDDIDKDTPLGWFEDAVKEAVLNNKRNLAYVMAILKRWNAEGRGPVGANGKQQKPAIPLITPGRKVAR